MITISAWFLKIDGMWDYYNQRLLQADLAFRAFVSNSGWFDGKHQRIHLISEMKKGSFQIHSFVSVIVFRQRTFFRRMLTQNET